MSSSRWLKPKEPNVSQSELRRIQQEKEARRSEPLPEQPPVETPPVTSTPPTKVPPVERPAVETTPATSTARTPSVLEQPPPEMDPAQKYPPLPPNAPHLRLPYAALDRLRLLKPGPRAVCEEIYRAAAGWHSDECIISIAKLATYCRIDDKVVKKYIEQLASLGYVERLGDVIGGSDIRARGVRFRVLLPRMQTKTPGRSGGGPETPPNKEKHLNKDSKSIDASLCPDCKGTNVWYPEGFDKGVAKCLHPNLPKD